MNSTLLAFYQAIYNGFGRMRLGCLCFISSFLYSFKRVTFWVVLLGSVLFSQSIFGQELFPGNETMPNEGTYRWCPNSQGKIIITYYFGKGLDHASNELEEIERLKYREAIENAIYDWNNILLMGLQLDFSLVPGGIVSGFDPSQGCPQSEMSLYFTMGAIDQGDYCNNIPEPNFVNTACRGAQFIEEGFGEALTWHYGLSILGDNKLGATKAFVDINKTAFFCKNNADLQILTVIAEHEIGHVLGLGHIDRAYGQVGLMGEGKILADPTNDEINLLGHIYGIHLPESPESIAEHLLIDPNGEIILDKFGLPNLNWNCTTNNSIVQRNIVLNLRTASPNRKYNLYINENAGEFKQFASLSTSDWLQNRYRHSFGKSYQNAKVGMRVIEDGKVIQESITRLLKNIPIPNFSISPDNIAKVEAPNNATTPTCTPYTLKNNGTTSLNWSITAKPTWLDASTTSGTLAVGGTTTVQVCTNSNIATLPIGANLDKIIFKDATSGIEVRRQIELTVKQCTPIVGISTAAMSFSQAQNEITTQPKTISNTAAALCANLTYQVTSTIINGTAPSIETVSDNTKVSIGDNRYRGDVYAVTKRTTLTKVESYLNFTGNRDLNFVVLEGDSPLGTFTIVQNQTVTRTGTGAGFYTSAPMAQLLLPNKYYIIGVGWTGGAISYHWNDAGPTPEPLSFGQRVNGFSQDVYPLANSITYNVNAAAFHQRLTTENIWLRVNPSVGSIAPAANTNLNVLADATGLAAGSYQGTVTVTSNDLTNPSKTFPVNLTVTACTNPVITTQPTNTTKNVGETATFTIAATGATTYRWYKTTSPTTTLGTAATLTLPSVSTASAGNYQCEVTNSCGSVLSTVVALVINIPVDTDNDGIPDSIDNCPLVSNPDQKNSDALVTTDLVYWKMDEGSANTINSSGIAATGTLVNSPTWVQGHSGTALQFNGTNQYVNSNIPLQGSSQATLAAWVKTSINQSGSYIVSVPRISGGSNGFDIGFNGTGVIRCCIISSGGGGFCFTSSQNYSDNQWHLIAATYDGSSTKLYWDGNLVNSQSNSGTLLTDNNLVQIGRFGGFGGYFIGAIDEVIIDDRALSSAEIKQLFLGAADLGDACDNDDDDDGTPDTQDACPFDPKRITTTTFYADADGDGYGNPSVSQQACVAPIGYVSDNTDCDDTKAPVHPNAVEIAGNGIDDNCDGCIDNNSGKALKFDGVNDFVEILDNATLRFCPTCPMTIEGWVYREGSNPIQHILGKRIGCNESTPYWQVASGDGSSFSFGNTTNGAGDPSGLPIGQWEHFAGVFDGANYRFYVNGVLKGSGTGALGAPNVASLFLGTSGTCPSNQYFNGQMDELRIWNYARSASQILAAKNKKLTCLESRLVAYYDFDEGSGTVLKDKTAYANNGTLMNGPTWVVSGAPICGELNECPTGVLTFNCPTDITVPLSIGQTTAIINYTVPTASSTCPIGTVTVTPLATNPASGTAFAVGTKTLSFTATDGCGNTKTCSFTITVNPAPTGVLTFTCPPNITVTAAVGQTTAIVNYTSPTASSTCTVGTVTVVPDAANPTSGSTFAVGTKTLSFSATDGCGNTKTCSFTITVNPAPTGVLTFTCPANITVTAAVGQTTAVVNYTSPTASSTCPIGTVTVTPLATNPASGSAFAIGTKTLSFTATDGCGNTKTCSFTVTVNPAPTGELTITCPANIAVTAAVGHTSAVVDYPTPAANSTCPVIVNCFPTSALQFNGNNDKVRCGNPANNLFGLLNDGTIEAWVKVTSILPPLNGGVCNAILGKDENSGIDIPKWFFGLRYNGLAFHINGPGYRTGYWVYSNALSQLEIGVWYHVAMTKRGNNYTFYLNGKNVGGGSITAPIVPNNAPLTIGWGEQNIESNEIIDDVKFWNTVRTDNEIIQDMTDCPQPNTLGLIAYYPMNDNQGQSTVSDHSGNANNGVLTNMNPSTAWVQGISSVCSNQQVTCDGDPQLLNGFFGNVKVTPDATNPVSGSTFAVGTKTLSFTATDGCGNTKTCSFTITVNPAPTGVLTFTCPANITVTAAVGQTTAVVSYIAPTASSTCPIGTVTVTPLATNPSSGSPFAIGTKTLSFTATDGCGNSKTCSFTVTVNRNCSVTVNLGQNQTICTGKSTTITANVTGGTAPFIYTWSNGATTPSVFVSPTTNATYTVNVADANSCSNSASQTIVVNALPLPPSVSNVNYCQNAIATALTATGSNIKWYTTATGGTGSTTAITPLTTTVGTISYFVSQTVNDCESSRAEIKVTINICGPDSDCDGVLDAVDLCAGGNDKIDNNHDGKADCHYFTSINQLIAAWRCGNNNYKVVICHIPPGNPANRQTLCVSANAVAAHLAHGDYIGSCDNAKCVSNLSGNSVFIAFIHAEAQGTQLSWISNTGYKTDFYQIQKLNLFGVFEELKIINNSNLDKELHDFNYYDNQPTEGDNFYRIKAAFYDGTSSFSETLKVNFDKLNQIRVYPNPTNSNIDILLNKPFGETTVKLFNILGVEVKKQTYAGTLSSLHLELGELPSGLYQLHVSQKGKRDFIKQIVIQR